TLIVLPIRGAGVVTCWTWHGDASSSSPTTRERAAAAPHAHTTTFALLPLLNVPHRGTAPVTHPPFPGDFVHNWASPTRAAISRRTRSEIDDASIFSMTAARWLSTVRRLISRRAAITLLGWPATTRSST